MRRVQKVESCILKLVEVENSKDAESKEKNEKLKTRN